MNVAVAATKFSKGFDGTGREVPDAYEVIDLRAAIERVYTTDAHLVTYVVEGATRQPRLNKVGLAYFDRPVHTTVFFCDVDNPAHAEWTDELLERARTEYATLETLQTCGVYYTAHGRRIMQPLEVPIPVAEVEPYLRRWLLALESDGIAVDWACRDWTRHFRLPHVRRNRRMYRSPVVELDRMKPIALEPIESAATDHDVDVTRRGPVTPRAPPPVLSWSHDLPPNWEPRCIAIAKAIRTGVSENWHEMYLALGGALLKRGCPPERLPTMILWIASTAHSSKPWSHSDSAKGTATRYVSGLEVTGHRRLRERWPGVADALDESTALRTEARLREQASSAPPAPPLAEATAALRAAIREAPDGLTVISAECGMGKTHVAIDVAAERAKKTHLSPNAAGVRAPAGSKTSISVDKNALAIQIANDLRAKGTPTRRIFGPLSVLRDDGTPECRFHAVARPLVEGGQPMQWELCQGRDREPCEYYQTCRAKDGVEGPSDARVTVGPHALVSELSGTAGSLGLLIVDEPPQAIESIALTRHDFADARDRMVCFESAYQKAMKPALAAFDAWFDMADAGTAITPAEAILQTGASVPDVLAAAGKAIQPTKRGQAPPILRQEIFLAKRHLAHATSLGAASKVLGTLHHALTCPERVVVRVEKKGETESLIVTAPRADFSAALRRQGAVVVTDANADIHLPVYEKIVGYKPRFHRFSAPDGAPIARTLLKYGSATRRAWFARGQVLLDGGVVAALREAIAWAREDPTCRRIGLITMRLVRMLLEAAARPDDAVVAASWKELGQPASALDEAKETLGPILRAFEGEIVFGHYGAMRGLNTMADVDVLVTLGDPWPNIGDVQNEAAFLGLNGAWEDRVAALCRAELEQAHGRLRAVHRTRPGRALHVGAALPGGYGWTSGEVEFRTMARGPAALVGAMTASEAAAAVHALGGIRQASRVLGCSAMTVSRYCLGERAVPIPIARELRSLRNAPAVAR